MPKLATKTVNAEAALAVINFIRLEKQPPLARYATLLALHLATSPLTASQISKTISCPGTQSGTMDSCLRNGLIEKVPGPTAADYYCLTGTGRKEVTRLLKTPHSTIIKL